MTEYATRLQDLRARREKADHYEEVFLLESTLKKRFRRFYNMAPLTADMWDRYSTLPAATKVVAVQVDTDLIELEIIIKREDFLTDFDVGVEFERHAMSAEGLLGWVEKMEKDAGDARKALINLPDDAGPPEPLHELMEYWAATSRNKTGMLEFHEKAVEALNKEPGAQQGN